MAPTVAVAAGAGAGAGAGSGTAAAAGRAAGAGGCAARPISFWLPAVQRKPCGPPRVKHKEERGDVTQVGVHAEAHTRRYILSSELPLVLRMVLVPGLHPGQAGASEHDSLPPEQAHVTHW